MTSLQSLVEPHIASFDSLFTQSTIPTLLSTIQPLTLKYNNSTLQILVTDIFVHKPFHPEKEADRVDRRLMHSDCRERLLTYRGKIVMKISCVLNGVTVHTEEKSGGYMPIMVGSVLCHQKGKEVGGYFVVNGLEKMVRFLVVQKRNFFFAQVKAAYQKKGCNFSDKAVMVRCVGRDEVSKVFYLHYANDGRVFFRMRQRRNEFVLPLAPLLRKLGGVTDKQIFELLYENVIEGDDMAEKINDVDLYERNNKTVKVGDNDVNVYERNKNDEILDNGDEENNHINLYKKGIHPLLKAKILLFLRKDPQTAIEEDVNKIQTHIENNKKKFLFLISGLKKLFELDLGQIKADDQDNSMNHEVLSVAQLITILIKEKIEDIYRGIKFIFDKKPYDLTRQSAANTLKKVDTSIGTKIEALLATGSCNTINYPDILQTSGFVVAAERINIFRFLSFFRCVNRGTYFTKVKVTGVRKLRPETFGFLCPVHTPDGTPCGILNHLSVRATVVFENEEIPLKEFFRFGMVEFNAGVAVSVDGVVVGYVSRPNAHKFSALLRAYRAEKKLKVEIVNSVGHECVSEGIFVFGGTGRMMRPVYNGREVDWIGIMEQVFLDIKSKVENVESDSLPKTVGDNYSEIDNTSFLSFLASLTPFSDHNQSPRNMYQCQMAKQSMGITHHDIKNRTDNKAYQLVYAQSPIVRTGIYEEYKEINDYPIGINAIVAVLSYTAYDMEDAMVINKSGIERGFFHNFVYKTEIIKLEKNATLFETVDVGTKIRPEHTLVRSKVEGGDIRNYRYKGFDEGMVDSVRIFNDPLVSQEINTVLVKLRIERNPTIGDKFCSRHGQKGVCSMKYPQVDLPFSESGLIPDIIINPHAFPSRMTVGMLIESLGAKSGCLRGEFKDGTVFKKDRFSSAENNNSQSEINKESFKENTEKEPCSAAKKFGEELVKEGFNYHGNEPMYSGVYGNEFETDIYIGVVYYQRLRHMVNDKFQVRTHGAVMPQTKQPIKGRSKQGGVRLGEMERDAIIGHGAAYLLQDRLLDCSDSTDFFYCVGCKSILFAKKNKCCDSEIVVVKMPYVFRYLCAELVAMCVKVELKFD